MRPVAFEECKRPVEGCAARLQLVALQGLSRGKPPAGTQQRRIKRCAPDQRIGLGEVFACLHPVRFGQVVAGRIKQRFDLGLRESPRVLVRQCNPTLLKRKVALRFAQLAIKVGHRPEQFDLQRRLRLEIAFDAARADIEQLARSRLAARLVGGHTRVARLEHLQQEVLHGRRPFGLFVRHARLPGHRRGSGRDGQQRHAEADRPATVPPQRAAGHVAPVAAPCQHRFMAAVAFHVGAHLIDAGVALLGFLAQGLGDDGVQVTGQLRGRHRGRRQLAGDAARCERALRDDLLHRRRERQLADRIGRRAAQQLVQQQAECMHVGSGGDGAAAELLG